MHKPKKKDKIEIYKDLKDKIKSLWRYKEVIVMPAVTGTLVIVSKTFEKWNQG